MKDWERKMPIEVVNTINEAYNAGKDIPKSFVHLKRKEVGIVTPISQIRRIARSYTKRYKVPIKLDEEYMDKYHPHADALHLYRNGKSTILLHPILQYYTPEYIRGCIEHELDHRRVERKWEKIL